MARKPRIHYEDALYHVIIRGNNRTYIFKNRENKEEYKKIVSKYKKRYRFKLYACCIMDNHAHLLIEVSIPALRGPDQGKPWKAIVNVNFSGVVRRKNIISEN